MNEGIGCTKLVDIAPMRLSDEELVRWRQSVIYAPSAATIKLKRDISLSSTVRTDAADVLNKLTSVMMYDKHGLLQLILYEDGREEIRKLSRKRIGEMKYDQISTRLMPWLDVIQKKLFSVSDLLSPNILQSLCNELGALADTVVERVSGKESHGFHAKHWISLRRLIHDLAEAITRCERIETFVSTSLFIFWVTDELMIVLEDTKHITEARGKGALFLRNYVATVLLLEKYFGSLQKTEYIGKDIDLIARGI